MPQKFLTFYQPDPDSALAEAGEALNALLKNHQKQPVLLLLSGGSAFGLLEYVGAAALGENLTISMLDERFSNDSAVNNFLQLQKLQFYVDAQEAGASFFGTAPRPGESSGQLARRWENNLQSWRRDNPDGLIFATLGMGADGHTAGIFPQTDSTAFKRDFYGPNWIFSYNAGGQNPYPERITATITLLRQISQALAFVGGQIKHDNLAAAIKGEGQTRLLPALAWHEIPTVKLFTDIKL